MDEKMLLARLGSKTLDVFYGAWTLDDLKRYFESEIAGDFADSREIARQLKISFEENYGTD